MNLHFKHLARRPVTRKYFSQCSICSEQEAREFNCHWLRTTPHWWPKILVDFSNILMPYVYMCFTSNKMTQKLRAAEALPCKPLRELAALPQTSQLAGRARCPLPKKITPCRSRPNPHCFSDKLNSDFSCLFRYMQSKPSLGVVQRWRADNLLTSVAVKIIQKTFTHYPVYKVAWTLLALLETQKSLNTNTVTLTALRQSCRQGGKMHWCALVGCHTVSCLHHYHQYSINIVRWYVFSLLVGGCVCQCGNSCTIWDGSKIRLKAWRSLKMAA